MKFVMMTLVTLASVFAFAASSSSAEKLSCKKQNEASNQGVELKVSGPSAIILNKGKTVAKLRLISTVRSGEIVTQTYSQQTINGYAAKVVSGGIVASVGATILHDGFAGLQPVAQLNDCR